MSDVVIDAVDLGKEYAIGTRSQMASYATLRDTLGGAAKRLGQTFLGGGRGAGSDPAASLSTGKFWALKDVSFQIRRGDVVGIIGRNGAGKSTLLKILSRITDPSEGRVTVRGRVASLLEVGTGFHPELSGRENIFLNGAILGMTRAEIKRKFDEIVAFAEVERFLETPVKRLSSGMYVRLAFAVAAHLEAEILIVDEVLAVGDAEFQRKCLGKMGEVAGGGRTVLLVSHNLAFVEQICRSALLLSSGRIEERGDPGVLVRRYLDKAFQRSTRPDQFRYRHVGNRLKIERVDFLVGDVQTTHVSAGDPCEFVVRFRYDGVGETRFEPTFLLSLYFNGQKVASLWTGFFPDHAAPRGAGTARCILPRWPFREGTVRLDIFTHVGPEREDWIEEILYIESFDGPFYGDGPLMAHGEGMMFIDHHWA